MENLPRADSPALAASDTTSMKPSAATSPRLAARVLIREKIGSSIGLALNVAFSAVCISPNTPEAVINTVSTPRTVARAPEVGSLDRARIDLMKSAPAGPKSWPSSSLIRCILAESDARDCNHNHKHRRERSRGIEGDSCPAAQGVVGQKARD